METVGHVTANSRWPKPRVITDIARSPERAERSGGEEPEKADDALECRCPFSTWLLYVLCSVALRLESDSTLDNLVPHNTVSEQLKARGKLFRRSGF